MVRWRVIHWEGSHLVQMVDLRYDTPMVSHIGVDMTILRDLHWDSSYLVQKQELR